MSPSRRLRALAVLGLSVLSAASCAPAAAQSPSPTVVAPAGQGRGTLVRDTVDSPALRGNRLGDSPRRSVTVYLPPSYARSPGRSYPTVYLLHGFDGRDGWWTGGRVAIQNGLDSLMAAGRVRELIVVMPDGFNAYGGSFWTDSPATGGWGTFVSRDLVRHVDRRYRTVRRAESRGLGGYSMGGYGALQLAARHPGVFGAVYSLSGCCMGGDLLRDPQLADSTWARTLALRTRAEAGAAGFFPRILLALGAAWTPDLAGPPLLAGLPFARGADGRPVAVDSLHAAWAGRSPEGFVRDHAAALRRLRAIGFDAGRSDGLVHIPATMRRLDAALTQAGIAHAFEEYEGTHGSHIPTRVRTHLLPFFSAHLAR